MSGFFVIVAIANGLVAASCIVTAQSLPQGAESRHYMALSVQMTTLSVVMILLVRSFAP